MVMVIQQQKVDPEDQGSLPPDLVPLSRQLAKVLRHDLRFLPADEDGWCPVDAVLRLPECQGWLESDLDDVVRESFSKSKPRFEMERRGDRGQWIRATHKHSFRCVKPGHTPAALPAPHRIPTHRESLPASDLAEADRGVSKQPPPMVHKAPPPVFDETAEVDQGSDPWVNGCDPWAKAKAVSPRQDARVVPPRCQLAKEAQLTERTNHQEPKVIPPRIQAAQDARPSEQAITHDAKVVPPRWPSKEEAALAASQQAAKRADVGSRTEASTRVTAESPREELAPDGASQVLMPQAFFIGEDEDDVDEEQGDLGLEADGQAQSSSKPAPAAAEEMRAGRSSLGVTWQQFGIPEEQGGGSWWHCARQDGQEDYFLEKSPAPWVQYAEASGRRYWWNAQTDEFFYSTDLPLLL